MVDESPVGVGDWATPRQQLGRGGLHRCASTPSLSMLTHRGDSIPLGPGLLTYNNCVKEARRVIQKARSSPRPPESNSWRGMFSSQPAQGPAAQGGVRHAKKLLATEETGQGHSQAESSGSQGRKSRSQCPSVSANLAWPKSPSPGATALKGVMWSHGQQLLHVSFIQSSGCPLEAQGRGYSWQGALDSPLAPLGLWLEEGQWKGQLLHSRRRSPWLRAGRGLQPSSWASLGSLA